MAICPFPQCLVELPGTVTRWQDEGTFWELPHVPPHCQPAQDGSVDRCVRAGGKQNRPEEGLFPMEGQNIFGKFFLSHILAAQDSTQTSARDTCSSTCALDFSCAQVQGQDTVGVGHGAHPGGGPGLERRRRIRRGPSRCWAEAVPRGRERRQWVSEVGLDPQAAGARDCHRQRV